jgi:hypothetical protein
LPSVIVPDSGASTMSDGRQRRLALAVGAQDADALARRAPTGSPHCRAMAVDAVAAGRARRATASGSARLAGSRNSNSKSLAVSTGASLSIRASAFTRLCACLALVDLRP